MKGFSFYYPRSHLSISSLVNFARCPRRAFYSSGCRLEPHEEPNYFLFGSAFHAGASPAIEGNLDLALSKFDSVWNESLRDDKRNWERGHLMLRDLHSRFLNNKGLFRLLPPPPNHLEIEDSISEHEIAWALDIDLPVPLVGRTDARAIRTDTQTNWIIEYKTSSELSARFMNGFELNPEIIGNVAAMSDLTGEPYEGGFVVGSRVSHVNTETLIHPVYVQKFQIEDFFSWAKFIGTQFLACETSRDFPKDFSGCSPYPMFGQPGYPCEFRNLCHMVEDWTTLASTFKRGEDRPFILAKKTETQKIVETLT